MGRQWNQSAACWILALVAGFFFAAPVGAVDILLNSWETADDGGTDPTNGGMDAPGDPNYNWSAREELEGWQDAFGSKTDPASLQQVTGTGNTDGNSAFQFTLNTNNFEWSVNRFLEDTDPQHADFVTALSNPSFHEISYDFTYNLTYSSPTEDSSFGTGLSLSVQEGSTDVFHQGFNLLAFDGAEIVAAGGNLSGTANVSQNLAAFTGQPFDTSNVGFIRPIISLNGDWDAPSTFIIDNLRISETSPPQDLDGNLTVDTADFAIFMMWHKSDFTGLTAQEAADRGDFDGDFDSDFDDYLSFESVFDQINGAGALANALSVSAPEPSALLLIAVGATGLMGARRRRPLRLMLLLVAGLFFLPVQGARALTVDTLESWESGLAGWSSTITSGQQVSGGASVATSGIGATDGTSSLAVTQSGDTFDLDPLFNSAYSYNAEVRYNSGTQLDALNAAFDVGSVHYELQVDVTFPAASGSVPSGSLISVGIGLEGNGAAFNTVQGLATTSISGGTTQVSIAQPLSNWNVPQDGSGTFFDISFGLNGDWGTGDATVYFDNLQLVQVSEPALLTLEIDRSDGSTRILNSATPGSMVEFDYYEIVSGNNALDEVNWDSLDDNLVPDDGWTAAGGASSGDLTEANLLGSSTLDGGEDFSLGSAFLVGGSEDDLAFRYREPERPGVLREGLISFVGDSPILEGDYNGDDVVDAADYALWRDNTGGTGGSGGPLGPGDTTGEGTIGAAQYNLWRSNYGATGAAPEAAGSLAPEPACLSLACLAFGGVVCRRNHRRRERQS